MTLRGIENGVLRFTDVRVPKENILWDEGLGLKLALTTPRYEEFGELDRHLRFVDRSSRRLARSTFHAIVRFGAKLERKQAALFRVVDIGAELFAMSATYTRAQWLLRQNPQEQGPVRMADLFCRQSRRRVSTLFSALFRNDDACAY